MDRAQRYVRTVATYGLRMRRSLFLSLMLRVVPGHARASRLSLCASLFSLWAAVVAGWLAGWLFVRTSRASCLGRNWRETRPDKTRPALDLPAAAPGLGLGLTERLLGKENKQPGKLVLITISGG